jgi:hypothetical protein
MSKLTIEAALPAIRDHFFPEYFASFFDQYKRLPSHKERCDFWDTREAALSKAHQAWRKLKADTEKFLRRAKNNAEQWQQIKKLHRFSQDAKYGPLSTAVWKRRRVVVLLNNCRRLLLVRPRPSHSRCTAAAEN